MATKPLQQFFDNKVKLVLENKHVVRGLIKSIDYELKTLTLIQVQDWGTEQGAKQQSVPVNIKFNEKAFDLSQVIEIEYEAYRFKNEDKKYNKDDFFDNLGSSCTTQKRNDRPNYKEREYNNNNNNNYQRGGRGYNNNNNNNNTNSNNYRGGRQGQGGDRKDYRQRKQQNNDRDYR